MQYCAHFSRGSIQVLMIGEQLRVQDAVVGAHVCGVTDKMVLITGSSHWVPCGGEDSGKHPRAVRRDDAGQ